MAVELKQFLAQLSASQLMAAADVETFVAALAPPPADGEQLARELVKQKKLTAFQAQQIYAGKGKSLALGNYRILDKLGQGGMGMVLKAEHKRMKRLVALKVLSPNVTKSDDARRRFQREVEAAAKLRHPNIVAADDADEAHGVHFLVMEYVEGSDLLVWVKKHGVMPLDKALHCVVQAARGLEYAHNHGVVHRDIKPANLLLDKEGTVKILDMGLARLEGAGEKQDELTGTGQIMGTVDFMSPEQAINTKQADARADIYSLGVTLWYLVTGQAMYGGESAMEKLMAHQTQPIPSLRDRCPAMSPALEAVFRKMVAKTPGERQQSMTAVIADLENCKTAEPSSPTHGTTLGEDTKLQEFLRGVNAATTAGQTMPDPYGTMVSAPPSATQADPYATIDTGQAPGDTDPETQHSLAGTLAMPAKGQAARPTKSSKSARSVKPGIPWQRNRPLLIASAAGGILVVLLGIWLIVRDKDGNEVARVQVPAGGTVTVQDGSPSNLPSPRYSAGEGSGVRGASAKFAPAPGDYALLFDDQQYVEVESLTYDPNLALAIEAFVQIDEKAPDVVHFARFAGHIVTTADQAWSFFQDPGGGASTMNSLVPIKGKRLHLAATKGEGNCQYIVFVDGRKVAGSGVSSPASQTLAGLRIGGQGKTLIDELRISKVQRYIADFARPERLKTDADTLALYHFDEGQGTQLLDSSGQKQHGKIVGAKWVRADGSAIPPAAGVVTAVRGPAPPPANAPFDAAAAKQHQEAWAKHLGTTVETTNSVGAKMILIPPGEFLMGSTDEQVAAALKGAEELKSDQSTLDRLRNSERPQHRVVISKPFRMGATEVTVGQYRQFVDASQYVTEAERYGVGNSGATVLDDKSPESDRGKNWRTPGYPVSDDLPVTQLSWNDAVAYCQWLTSQEKATYRLPSEAEWEFACRAGTTTQYSFGDDANRLDQFAWHFLNSAGAPHPVGLKGANSFNLRDMHGNAREWCQDFYEEKWYEKSPAIDPTGPPSAFPRVLRGGSSLVGAVLCRSAFRVSVGPSYRNTENGFRVVRVLERGNVDLKSVAPNLKSESSGSRSRGQPPPLAVAPFDAKQARAHQDVWAKHLNVPTEISNTLSGRCRLIPPGEFTMGSTQEEMEFWQKQETLPVAKEGMVGEVPPHRVRLTKPFYAGVHEVTVRQFRAFAEATGFKPTGPGYKWEGGMTWTPYADCTWEAPGWEPDPEEPVVCLSRTDVLAFCRWLSNQEQRTWRLPTEAEWEYMARAGTTTPFWIGTELTPQTARIDNAVSRPAKVGSFAANPFGLFDIQGNVWERTSDFFDRKTYQRGAVDDPQAAAKGPLSADRGGGWFHTALHARSANRGHSLAENRVADKGFRIVCDVPPAPAAAVAPFEGKQARAHQDAWAKHLGTTIETTNSVGAKLALIPPGQFVMGLSEAGLEQLIAASPSAKAHEARLRKEMPAHTVTLSRPFWMGTTEVTRREFAQFVAATRYKTEAETADGDGSGWEGGALVRKKGFTWQQVGEPQTDQHAVGNVTWNDAVAFCNWLSAAEKLQPCYAQDASQQWTALETGSGYRLPTEAEWEFACRAGTQTEFSWGDNGGSPRRKEHAQIDYSASGQMRIFPVAQKLPNAFGLFDTVGNATEWCQDGWSSYGTEPQRDPRVAVSKGVSPVVRGGGASDWFHMRSASRQPTANNRAQANGGFRVVRAANAGLGDGRSETARLKSAGTTPAAGARRFALDFTKDASVELPTLELDPSKPLTVEGWAVMRPPAADARDPLLFALDFLRLRVGVDHSWIVSVNAAGPTPTRIFKSEQPITAGRRTHFALVWTGKSVALYIDGRLQLSGDFAAQHSSQPHYALGKTPVAMSFEGQLHAVRMSRTVRYTGATFQPTEQLTADADTLAMYLMDEGQGEVLNDSSGHGRHGKITGAQWVPVGK